MFGFKERIEKSDEIESTSQREETPKLVILPEQVEEAKKLLKNLRASAKELEFSIAQPREADLRNFNDSIELERKKKLIALLEDGLESLSIKED